MADYLGYIYALVATLVIITETSADCKYPQQWGVTHWATQRLTPKPAVLGLLTFKEAYDYTSNTTNPVVEKEKLTCSAEETVNDLKYTIQTSSGAPNVKYCVEQSRISGGANNKLILQRKQQISSTAAPTATIEKCKADLVAEKVFSIFLPVSPNTQQIDSRINCPFPNIPYLVSFITKSGSEFCKDNRNSVLSINVDLVSILVCDSSLFPGLPLTGVLKCKATIDPRDLGEPDSSNGDIVLLQWVTESNSETFIYCVRYKVHPSGDVEMSLDLTSHSEVGCKRDHRYDQFSDPDRELIKMMWKFDGALTSPKMTMSTRLTTKGMAQSSTTLGPGTTRSTQPPQADKLMQFALDKPVTAIENQETFKNELQSQIADAAKVNSSRIDDIVIEPGKDGNAVVTFTLKGGSSPIMSNPDQDLNKIIDTGYFEVGPAASTILVKPQTFYSWRDTDNCPDNKCLNGGRCWMIQGEYSCKCQDYTGDYCATKSLASTAQPATKNGGGQMTTIIIAVVVSVIGIVIIIVVVVLVMKKRKKSSGSTDSESGYDNQAASIDDRDRELYSTINKRPKAFHEKSFTSLESSDYGERTGIHL